MSEQTNQGRTATGTVVSNKGEKTAVVKVERLIAHPKYKKRIRRSTKLHAHDENNECNVGDIVTICETRPMSKLKTWRVVNIDRKAN